MDTIIFGLGYIIGYGLPIAAIILVIYGVIKLIKSFR